MRRAGYVPERGDIVWLAFSLRTGHEQAGRRPALVLSPASYNGRTGMALCCPITSRIKGYPFEVSVDTAGIQGVALADQMRTLDWRARRAKKQGAAPQACVIDVLAKLHTLLAYDAT